MTLTAAGLAASPQQRAPLGVEDAVVDLGDGNPDVGERGDSTDTVDVCFEGGGDVLFVSELSYDFGPI